MNNIITREELIEILQNKVAKVVFTKVDGTERDMFCTLNTTLIPQPETETNKTETNKTRAINENVIPVWDMEKNNWRSFRIDSIISVE